jgi:hypothetical protein
MLLQTHVQNRHRQNTTIIAKTISIASMFKRYMSCCTAVLAAISWSKSWNQLAMAWPPR